MKEMGISVSEYIRRKRVEAAENMLRYSDYTLIEISQYLAFSSYSHFAGVFHAYTGLTPKEYRKRFYRKRSSVNYPG
jgi:AraC-like DNA-binding protein